MSPTLAQPAIVALTLLALALGGSVDLWAQTIVLALAGLLILVAPPRTPLPRTPLLVALLLLLLAAAAFLPAPPPSWIAWRHYLAFDAHVWPWSAPAGRPLDPGTWTPQPWLTLQACALLFAGLVWALYLLQQPWDKDSRVRIAEGLVFGVAILAAVSAAAFIIGFRVPIWNQEQNRGWFPNRNQTADVLALAGVTTYALIFDRLRKGRRSGYFLLVALIPILTELVISYSRAGILLFFGGLVLWHFWPRPGKKGGTAKWVVLSAALTLVLIAMFLTLGGDTLGRFQNQGGLGMGDFSDFRGAIQEDAFRFSLESPLLGTGLGNFEPLFSFSRVDSINANRAIHPESDWLWIASEMGWIAPVLLLIGIVWWFRRCLPLENRSGESMRLAFIVCGIVFIIHGFVDVSGHRIGSLFVGLLMASLALPAIRAQAPPSRGASLFFRCLGAMLLLIALWWWGSIRGLSVPPTTASLARLQNQFPALSSSVSGTQHWAREALGIAPLNWNLYFRLGSAEALQPGQTQQAIADFATARALNPYWIELMLDEGQVWRSVNQPDLCLEVWRDGLKRAGPQAPEAFREMVGIAAPHSVEREGLAELAFDQPEFLLTILPSSPPTEADALLSHLLQVDPTLHSFTADQREKLFAAWWTQGNQVRLMEVLRDHPEWDSTTWTYQAQFAAKENDFQHACEIMDRWVEAPALPKIETDKTVLQLEQDFQANSDNLTAGLVLFFTQVKNGSVDEALITLHFLLNMPRHPAYLAYMEAHLYAGKQDWQSAWAAWQSYLNPPPAS